MRLALAIVLLAVGCGKAPTACDQSCSDLVTQCDYQAFPSFGSCEQGCAYWESQGADIQGYLQCLNDAQCNTFATVECEHDFGPSAQ